MRTLEELRRDAKNEVAFSNGESADRWYFKHCGNCANEPEDENEQAVNGCPLWTLALCEGMTPMEWTPAGGYAETEYTCEMFRHRDDGPDPEPQPIPDPPGMDPLFPREPYEGVRMFRPYITEAVNA